MADEIDIDGNISLSHLVEMAKKSAEMVEINSNSSSERAHQVLESHLMSEYFLSLGKNLSELKIFNKSSACKICRWCFVTWKSGMFSVVIEPEKRKGKSVKYLLNKNREKLNKFQRKLLKRCQKNSNCNFLVVKCHICHKKTKVPMKKPEKHSVNECKGEEILSDELKRKKKKKRKDLCAGLNPEVVKSSTGASNQKINILSRNNSSGSFKPYNSLNCGNELFTKIGNSHINKQQSKKIKRILNESKNNNAKQKPVKKSLLSAFLDSL